MDSETADREEVEKENKAVMAQYFKIMKSKMDLLANAQKNKIHITYPINEKSAGDHQKELMPSGTVLIRHTSPVKDAGGGAISEAPSRRPL